VALSTAINPQSLVEGANYRLLTQGTSVSHSANPLAACAASPGDFITNKVVAGDATAYTVTLPPVIDGGPVVVKVIGTFGQVSNSVLIIPQVADTVAGTLIDGFGSLTLVQPNALVALVSDGAQWWIISRSHQTTDTW